MSPILIFYQTLTSLYVLVIYWPSAKTDILAATELSLICGFPVLTRSWLSNQSWTAKYTMTLTNYSLSIGQLSEELIWNPMVPTRRPTISWNSEISPTRISKPDLVSNIWPFIINWPLCQLILLTVKSPNFQQLQQWVKPQLASSSALRTMDYDPSAAHLWLTKFII